MNLIHCLIKPYYVYQPAQIWRRLRYEQSKRSKQFRWMELPWGLRMFVSSADDLGQALGSTGINDLMVSESIFRLLDPGESAVDVGANVGYTTSIMAARVGPAGKVRSFEPHPQLFVELNRHADDWRARGGVAEGVLNLCNAAVSRESGWATLVEPDDFRSNRGRSQLDAATTGMLPESPLTDESSRHLTRMVTLDETLADAGPVGLLKVDVEGHEEEVFAGAVNLLATGRIRDIVFEEFEAYPGKTHRLLENQGYEVFTVEEHLRGPQLVTARPGWKAPRHVPPNYLATLDAARLRERFRPRGWRCLTMRREAGKL